MIKCFTTNRSN